MKFKPYLLCFPAVLALSGCATSSSDVKLAEVPSGQGVLFGYVEVYNGNQALDGDSMYTRCWLFFSNEKGDQIAKVKTDETGWIFASVPVGKTYLSEVRCNAGFMKAPLDMETRDLSFEVPHGESAAYFGDMTMHFNYHGSNLGAMFGLVGAAVQAAGESGKNGAAGVQVENHFDAAKQEFQKRYGADNGSFKLVNQTIVPNFPIPAPSSQPE